jgi:hypothetical protein
VGEKGGRKPRRKKNIEGSAKAGREVDEKWGIKGGGGGERVVG